MAKAKILSALAVTLGLLFASGQAHAQNPPPPQCNAGPVNYNGDVDIAPSGSNDCIINGDVTATGYIRINAPLGKIQVTGNITASNHGNVILSAGSTVEVGGSIVANNASAPLGQAGSVDVKANVAGSGPAFVIGSASSNGVAGTITTDTALGGGNDAFFIRGGIRIRNRNDITLTSASALSVKGTASRSGVIILEAVDGNLSLPTGTLSADGQTGQSAGAIVLQAHTITTQDGTIVSASDSVGQASHFVNIAASSVSFQGSTGLTIRANGGGSTANGTGSFAYALPEFGIFVTDDSSTNPQNFTWTVTYPFGTAYPGGLTWDGAVGSPLNFTANGTSHTQVLMTGYPLVFNGGDLLLAARGQEDHRIDLTYTGSTSGINGLVVNANKLTLNANANANAGVGGDIFVSIPRPTSASPQQVLFTADGPASASANGGTVQFFPKGDVTLGGNAGQFHLSAQSGSLGGNGGRATVSNKPFTTELASNTAVQVTARGQNGDGGYLELRSLFANFNGTGLKLAADATGSGKGGEIVLDVDGPITVGSGFGAVKLSAEADATVGSDGGKITVTSGSSADITSGQLSVKSGPTGSGGQLDLTIGGSLSLTGSLKADAGLSGNGHGGLVKVDAGDLVLNGSTTGGGQSLSADGAGTGAGGSVTAIIQASSHPTIIAGQQQGALSLSANGGKDATGAFLGAGGVLQLRDLNEGFVITGAALSVKSGSGQNGGSIIVDAGATLAVSGDLRAVGTGTGANGGTIRLTAQSVNTIVFSGTSTTNILADGGSAGATGNAGHITISNAGTGNIEFQQSVIVSATAEGTSGLAGTVSMTTGGDIVFSGSGNKIKTNGNGAEGVENIHLLAAGDITTGVDSGKIELQSKGTAAGHRGGFINIASTAGDIVLDTTAFTVRSGGAGTSGADGDGGKIEAQAASDITVLGDLDASGRGNGSGGSVTFTAPGEVNASGKIDVSGGCGTGGGGSIEITSGLIGLAGANANTGSDTCTVVLASVAEAAPLVANQDGGSMTFTGAVSQSTLLSGNLHADAQTAGRRGGVITFNNAGFPADFSQINQLQNVITARGGPNGGRGGYVYFAEVSKIPDPQNPNNFIPLNINKIINVDGDATLLSTAEEEYGVITLNLVQCQQRTTGQTSWPKSYWNCVHPAGSTANEKAMPAAANKLHANMKSNLRTQKVEMYVMVDITDFVKFHGAGPTDTEGVAGFSDVVAKVSAAFRFELYPTGNTDISPYYTGTIIHELGHQLDENVWGTHAQPASETKPVWLAANSTATTAFDEPAMPPPAVNHCPERVDADRAVVQLPAICSKFDGHNQQNPFQTNSQGLSEFGGVPMLDKRERFVRAFAEAYRRANPTIITQTYGRLVDAQLPAEQNYMDAMIVTGAPN